MILPLDEEIGLWVDPRGVVTATSKRPLRHCTAGDMFGEMDRALKAIEAAGPIVPRITRMYVRARVDLEGLEAVIEQVGAPSIHECPGLLPNRVTMLFADGAFATLKIHKDKP